MHRIVQGLGLAFLLSCGSVQTGSSPCSQNEVPYFEAGCEGPGIVKCWPEAVHPTPMETCLCDGRTGMAPLPGGGLRWKHAGKCL